MTEPRALTDDAPAVRTLLDAGQVAELLGVSTDWIYSETRAGRIPHVKLGRYRRYRHDSIEAWLVELESGGSVAGTAKRGGTAVEAARPRPTRGKSHEHDQR